MTDPLPENSNEDEDWSTHSRRDVVGELPNIGRASTASSRGSGSFRTGTPRTSQNPLNGAAPGPPVLDKVRLFSQQL